jgi:hypothetical protein
MKTPFLFSLVLLMTLSASVCSFAQITFTNVTEQAGIGDPGDRGVAWGDYDNDGDLDLYVSFWQANVPSYLFRNNGDGTFTDVTHVANVGNYEGNSEGAVFGDYDDDGYLDLYVLNEGGAEKVLYRNNGDGTFADVSAQAGVNDRSNSLSGTFVDYDSDGDLDIYVASWGAPNLLYRSNGDGTFIDVAKEAGVADPRNSLSHQFADYDNDGDMDLYVVNGGALGPAPDALYRNNGNGTFTEATKQTGILHPELPGAGVIFFDYNNDGWLDLYIANDINTSNLLYRNNKDGTFTNVSQQAGVDGGDVSSWGATAGDYDNDGWLDLLVSNSAPNSLYRNNRDGTFTNIAAQAGITEDENTMCVSSGDYDGDGFLDLFMTNGYPGGKPGLDALYRNNGNDNHWLQINLVGVRSNPNGIGARIHVVTGDLSMFREVNGGTGFGMDNLTAEFGLGKHNMVELVEIRWPSGTVDVLRDIPADHVIQVTEGTEQFTVAVQPRGKLPITLGEVKRTALRTALLQNYPNPFNPDTWIPYHLRSAAHVYIKIYDAAGHQLRILDLGYRDAGVYVSRSRAAYWDGMNELDEEVASGLYFYSITAGDFSATRKMIMMR